MHVDKRRKWKPVAIVFMVIACISFVWSMSFLSRGFPTNPEPAIGRVYPLYNHGYVTYLTRIEWLEFHASLYLSFIFMGIYVAIDFWLDRYKRMR